MQKEQTNPIDIIQLKKNEFQTLDIVAVRKKTFASIDALFQLLSADAIEQQSFSYQSAQIVFDHTVNVLFGEQRQACFIPQAHQMLTLLESLQDQIKILQYVQQVLAISQILDMVGKEITIPSQFFNELQRVIRHDVYVPQEFDTSQITKTIVFFEPLLQLENI